MKILPYRKGSKSCTELSKALGVKRLKLVGSKWRPNEGTVVLNFGNTAPNFDLIRTQTLNMPEDIRDASNKRLFFEKVNEALTVPYTVSKRQALLWITEGSKVVARATLSGHSGEGITIHNDADSLPDVPLYTKYVKKEAEYRVHVFCGEVIDVQKKMRRRDVPDNQVNWQVRNHCNGFIFGRGDGNFDPRISACASSIMGCLAIDFGAVDIIYNAHSDKYLGLEVNTAPGLTGTTLDNYVKRIREVVGRWNQ